MRFYRELAHWWPLFSPPSDYGEEAADLLVRLRRRVTTERPSLLELGAGGGSLALHLAPHFVLTLTDLSPAMLDVSRVVNPNAEHIVGDMRTLRLDRVFDVVLVHDAICYATTPAELQATLMTAAVHCRPGGAVMVVPDFVRETFTAGSEEGGYDASDGRAFRYVANVWDPDPADDTCVVDYTFTLRDADGTVNVEHDRHVEGLFARAFWLEALTAAGLEAASEIDRWGRDVFLARKLEPIVGAHLA